MERRPLECRGRGERRGAEGAGHAGRVGADRSTAGEDTQGRAGSDGRTRGSSERLEMTLTCGSNTAAAGEKERDN